MCQIIKMIEEVGNAAWESDGGLLETAERWRRGVTGWRGGRTGLDSVMNAMALGEDDSLR